MTPRQKLGRVSALAGWLVNETVVLPFALQVDPQRRVRPQISALPAQLVTVFLSPQPYVGLTSDMRAAGEAKQVVRRVEGVSNVLFDGMSWQDFENMKVPNSLSGILDGLERFWSSGVPFVTRFGAIRRQLCFAAHEAFSGDDVASFVD